MKKKVKIFLSKKISINSTLFLVLAKINQVIFHRNERLQIKSFGDKNPDKTFFVIRRFGVEEGLMSLFWGVFRDINYALEEGYIPYVDFQNSVTQYTTNEIINNTRNAWEYYFKQPCRYTIDEIYQSKNVILSGRNKEMAYKRRVNIMNTRLSQYDYSDAALTHEFYEHVKKYADVQPYIKACVEEIWNEKMADKEVIGIFLRGTDYIAFQPSGHPIQPTKELIYDKTVHMLEKHPESVCFVVTEDESVYTFMQERLKERLIEVESFRFKQYKGDEYVYKYCENNAYQIGLHYLINLLLISRCTYLVTSLTTGSRFANVMNDNKYKERIAVDLGRYK